MSKLLLDTHVLLWSVLEPARLSGDAKKQLEDPAFELWLSPISTWEIMVLSEKGRIALGTSPEVFMQMVFSSTPLREAPLTHQVAIESRRLALPHQDPADRFIAASAKVFGLTLATADKRLLDAARDYRVLAVA